MFMYIFDIVSYYSKNNFEAKFFNLYEYLFWINSQKENCLANMSRIVFKLSICLINCTLWFVHHSLTCE